MNVIATGDGALDKLQDRRGQNARLQIPVCCSQAHIHDTVASEYHDILDKKGKSALASYK
jgi:hypothetical protein